ncbi:MAG: glycosyltransferase family 9 protein [Candidatus Omnitrophica bacterium]|nr:glycosyltransferase family 9 protein [Candidatus Omnitrophota bacterium]
MKILFITLSNIGDVILTLPVLTTLKHNFTDAKIDVMVGPRAKDIFSKDPGINRIFIYDKHRGVKKKLDFIKDLRKENYDLAIDMKTSLVPFLIGAKKRSSWISLGTDHHKRTVHLRKLRGLGLECKDRQNIHIDQEDRKDVSRLLNEAGVREGDVLIGISADCRSHTKEWQAEKFAEVIKKLLGQKRFKAVLMGDGLKPRVSSSIKELVKDNSLIDMVGKTDLNQLFALIERLEILLTCDSACMHIAGDLGIKVLALFGPTDVKKYGPTGRYDIVIRKDLGCSPCNRALCRLSHECMQGISAEEVLTALKKLI